MTLKWFHIVGIFLAVGIIFFACYPRIENFFVFFPQEKLDLQPMDLGLQARDMFVTSGDDVLIHSWFFEPPDDDSPVLLFCHGNAGNISHRLDNVRHLLRHGLGVMLFDYRGYGRSTGRPSEKGVYQDGRAVYEQLVEELGISPERIVPFGRSLGAAVAMEVALHHPVRCVILESAFTSTRGMARQMGPFALLSPVLPVNYDNLNKVRRLEVPKLIIHGRADEIVPFRMGETLFRAAPEPKAFLALDGAGHNDTYVVGGEPYFEALAGFAKDPAHAVR
jgi:uncharacterized protein